MTALQEDTVSSSSSTVFTGRVISVWNAWPSEEVNYSSINAFKQSITKTDFTQFLGLNV